MSRSGSKSDDGSGGEGKLQELSVEAMNRLRASLGLAPLATGNSSSAIVPTRPDEETFIDSTEKDREEQRKIEEEREEDAARSRALKKKTLGLGERILKEEGGEDEDLKQWLAKSREREAKAQENAKMDKGTAEAIAKSMMSEPKKKRRRTGKGDEDDGETHVRFAAHAEKLASQFGDQEDVVLTLKDSRVIAEDGEDLNEDDDVLENYEESMKERREQALAEAKKTRECEKYDDNEFEELRGDKTIPGVIKDPGSGTGVASEYYTSEEMTKLFKRKGKKGGSRRNKRNTTADSVGEKSLEEMLQNGDGAAGIDNRGGDDNGVVARPVKTKEEIEKEALDSLQQMTSKQKKMDKAIAKERRKALMMAHTEDGLDEEDEELYKTLSRTRAVQQREQQHRHEERVVQSLAVKQEPMEEDSGNSAASSVVVDDMSTFLTKIEARKIEAIAEAKQQRQQQLQQQQQELQLQQQEPLKREPMEDTTGDRIDADHDESDDDDDQAPFREESLYSMSATLAQLAKTGGVEKTMNNSTILIGRKQDGVIDLKDDPAPHLKLEYLDADGMQLRPKEVFRQMSYIFHGRKPHQKRLEKLARQKEEARRVAEMESTDTPLHAVAMMERLQQETQQPYLVLTGKGAQNSFLNLKKE